MSNNYQGHKAFMFDSRSSVWVVKQLRILLLSLLVFTAQSTAYAKINPNILFSNINKSLGLANNLVNMSLQDKNGFVWIATGEGLIRYEGNHFKIFKSGDSNNTLKANHIQTLFQDTYDNIWIGTRLGGLTRYNLTTKEWKTFLSDSTESTALINDEILAIHQDVNGHLWVGTEKGLELFDYETETFTHFQADKKKAGSIGANAILSINEDEAGRLWVGTWDGGLNLMLPSPDGNMSNNTFRQFIIDEAPTMSVWSIYFDNFNRMWIGTHNNGLILVNKPSQISNHPNQQDWSLSFTTVGKHTLSEDFHENETMLSNNIVRAIHQDKQNNLWIGTSYGLNCIKAADLSSLDSITTPLPDQYLLPVTRYCYKVSQPQSLAGDVIYDIMEDQQGIIWFSTSGGVSQYNLLGNQFELYYHEQVMKEAAEIHNIYIDKNDILWAGSRFNGLIKHSLGTKQTTLFKSDKNDPQSIPNNFISTLQPLDDRYLMLGTGQGVSKFDMKSGKSVNFKVSKADQKKFGNPFFATFYVDSKKRIWCGTDKGLMILNDKTGASRFIFPMENKELSLSDNSINNILEDSEGYFWISTYHGLNRVKFDGDKPVSVEKFHASLQDKQNTICSNRVVSLLESNGKIWIGTQQGLSNYDLHTKQFSSYNQDFEPFIYTLIKDDHNRIWGSTTEGLFMFDTQKNKFKTFGKKDGLNNTTFRLNSGWRNHRGKIYFVNRSGFVSFDPNNISYNSAPPKVVITELKTINKKGETSQDILNEKTINLAYDDYYVAFRFTGLTYNQANKNNYAYQLEGFDNDWIYSEKSLHAVYTNLDAGQYKLKVKAANNDGVWNEQATSINVIVHPVFYDTIWFKALMALFLFGGMYLFYRIRTKSIKARNNQLNAFNKQLSREIGEREKVEQALKQRELLLKRYNEDLQRSNQDLEQFAYAASHDLQEPLRMVGNFVGILRKSYAPQLDQSAKEYIDFAVQGVTRMSALINNILKYSKVGRQDMEFKATDLNKMIELKLIDLSQKIKEKNAKITVVPMNEAVVCEKSQLGMVFYNLINNGLKFNKQDNVQIKVQMEEDAPKGFWKFSVRDNGIGISEEFQQTIFDVFTRLHHRGAYEGTGVGLALCNKIITGHKGKIWVESEPNKGSTFYFTISKKLVNSTPAYSNSSDLIKTSQFQN